MHVYLRANFQGSSIILTSFRQVVILPPVSPILTSKQTPKRPTQVRVNLQKNIHSICEISFSREYWIQFSCRMNYYMPEICQNFQKVDGKGAKVERISPFIMTFSIYLKKCKYWYFR